MNARTGPHPASIHDRPPASSPGMHLMMSLRLCAFALLALLITACGGGGGGGGSGTTPPPTPPPGGGSPPAASAFVRVDPADRRRLIDGQGNPLIIRGIQLEGWLHQAPLILGGGLFGSETTAMQRLEALVGATKARAFRAAIISDFITEADVARMAELGFNTVRVPINHVALDTYNDGWEALDRLIGWCRTRGVYVMLDLHAAPSPQNGSGAVADYQLLEPQLFDADGRRDETRAMWRQLALRYRDEPTVLGYDLLNEPDVPASPAVDLMTVYRALVAEIRAVDSSHLLILEGDDMAKTMSAITDRIDANACLSYHTYNYLGEDLATQLTAHASTAATLGMPLFNGEFGGNRTSWVRDARLEMEKPVHRASGWVFWTWKSVLRSGGDFLGIPYEDVHYVRDVVVDSAWKKLIAHLSGELFAPVPTAAEAETGMASFLQAIRLENTLENDGIVEALFAPPVMPANQ